VYGILEINPVRTLREDFILMLRISRSVGFKEDEDMNLEVIRLCDW
jgi:hypothetical protein